MNQQVKLISVTPDAEKNIAYCARVSNPNNQDMRISLAYLIIVLSTITGVYLKWHL